MAPKFILIVYDNRSPRHLLPLFFLCLLAVAIDELSAIDVAAGNERVALGEAARSGRIRRRGAMAARGAPRHGGAGRRAGGNPPLPGASRSSRGVLHVGVFFSG